MRLAVPPVAGRVQMLPCISTARVRPSGEAATDIEVPSLTVTLTGRLTFWAASVTAAREITALKFKVRLRKAAPRDAELTGPLPEARESRLSSGSRPARR